MPFIILISLLIMTYYVIYLYLFSIMNDGWVLGDWLINFDGGFVRRGLSGYLIIAFSDFFNLKLNITVLDIQIVLVVAYMFILLYLLKSKELNIWFLLMLLSPATLLFSVLNPQACGRKEIILFFIYALYILSLKHRFSKLTSFGLLFSVLLILAAFFHELVFFFLPYFIFSAYLQSKISKVPFPYFNMGMIVSGPVLALILLYFFGKEINGDLICSGLMQRGLTENICIGVLSFPKGIPLNDLLIFTTQNHYFLNYGICTILGLIPFVFFNIHSKHPVFPLKHFLIIISFLFVSTLPLFILAIDWGRWLHIHFMLMLFTFTLLLKDKNTLSENGWSENKLALPRLWKTETVFSLSLNNSIIILSCVAYLSSWYMKYFDDFDLFSFQYKIAVNQFVDLCIHFFVK